MSVTISLQPGQPGEGMEYNPRKVLPYPIHVDVDSLDCGNVPWPEAVPFGDFTPRLIGFQATAEPDPEGLLLAEDWLDGVHEACVGMYPVLTTEDGGMANLTVPITSISVAEIASR